MDASMASYTCISDNFNIDDFVVCKCTTWEFMKRIKCQRKTKIKKIENTQSNEKKRNNDPIWNDNDDEKTETHKQTID